MAGVRWATDATDNESYRAPRRGRVSDDPMTIMETWADWGRPHSNTP